MRIIVMFILFFGVSQIAYAEKDRKEDIEAMVKNIVESPQEYDIPQETLIILAKIDKAVKDADVEVKKMETEFQLARTRLSIQQLEKQRLGDAFRAEFRVFLTSKGVSYDDLPKWKIDNNRAVREKLKLIREK